MVAPTASQTAHALAAPTPRQGSGTGAAGRDELRRRYITIRRATQRLIEPLQPEDCTVQSMAEASPAKWHLAHTTWFFEAFVLQAHAQGYVPAHPQFGFLFNSYYNALGERVPRASRGLMTRPNLREVMSYRAHVDRSVLALLDRSPASAAAAIHSLVELGLNHEQQHQELILTDIKHLLSLNPLRPAYRDLHESLTATPLGAAPALHGVIHEGGLHAIGHASEAEGFAFDNESPRHAVHVEPFSIASRLVTNAEYLSFMRDGGYQRPELWLDMGWAIVRSQGWSAPLYWEPQECDRGRWRQFTLFGMRDVVGSEPVCHVSYFEADAYARWAGARLPTEQEWEIASQSVPVAGHFAESMRFHPGSAAMAQSEGGVARHRGSADGVTGSEAENPLLQMFGDAWEWTASPYVPYPGYVPLSGALGEYNGKFMCNQFVLRGGSCATPASHMRRTYRNFFPPEARWQFTGIRLAKDVR